MLLSESALETQIGANIPAHPNLLTTSRLARLCNTGSDRRLHVGHSRPGSRMAHSWQCAQYVVEFCAELVHIGPQVLLRCIQRIQILLILGNPMGDPLRTPDQTCSSSVPEVVVIRDASCGNAYVTPHCSKVSDTQLFRCLAANGRRNFHHRELCSTARIEAGSLPDIRAVAARRARSAG